MKDCFRPNIQAMSGYTPGMQPQGDGWVKLNTNENPYPPSPAVPAAIAEASGELRKYPDPVGDSFREAAAEVLGVRREEILCGNGSDDILTIITRAFCGEGDAVAYPEPTYSLYPVLAQIQGCRSVEVDFPPDYSLPAALPHTGAKVVFLANPNAPTGTFIAVDAIGECAARLDGMLVVDEAYVDFADDHAVRLVREHPNVIVSRSLSKSYSLAGLRFGFAVAQPQVIEGLMKVKDSYNVDRLATAAATAAIRDQEWMGENVRRIRKTRARLSAQLGVLGFDVMPSHANFVLARCRNKEAAQELFGGLKSRRVLVRYFDLPRVDDCLRITVGTDEEIDTLLVHLGELM